MKLKLEREQPSNNNDRQNRALDVAVDDAPNRLLISQISLGNDNDNHWNTNQTRLGQKDSGWIRAQLNSGSNPLHLTLNSYSSSSSSSTRDLLYIPLD